jgi:hypothetical protein
MQFTGLGRSTMRHLKPILAGLFAAQVLCGFTPSPCPAQELPAPAAPTVGPALLPSGISEEGVEIFGRYCYIWQELPDTQVIQYEGDFSLDMGQRHVSANDATVWIQRSKYEGRVYASLQIFLWRDAKVTEPGGTITRGDVLFATLNTFGNVGVNYRVLATRSAEDTPLYRRAARVRDAYQQNEGQATPNQQVTALSVLRTREPGALRPHTPRRRVIYRADNVESVAAQEQRVMTATGNVYIAQGETGTGDFLEIRADSAVIWLRGTQIEESLGGSLSAAGPGRAARASQPAAPQPSRRQAGPSGAASALGGMGGAVTAVYLEGDVVLTLGERMVRARRLYYDFENDQAYILDAVIRVNEPVRGVPFYVRAQEVRQLARDRYEASNAKITTDEFNTPHYHIGADKVVVVDRTPRDATGGVVGMEAGVLAAKDLTFNVGGVPVFWWPYTRADVRQGEVALRSYRFGFSNEFGVTSQSRWNLFTGLGLPTPEGFNADLRLDYFGKRGPAVGLDMDYKREQYNGMLRSYFVYDQGTDTFGRLEKDIEPPQESRGRFTWRHRQYLADDWQVTLEFSYLSDANFLREYFRDEYNTGKEQENLIYAKKQRDNWAFTAMYKNRLNSFQTQSESLPDFNFYLLGEPLLDNNVTTFTDARAGLIRYQQDNQTPTYPRWFGHTNTDSTRVTSRADLREEADVPLDLGPVRLAPFGAVRGSYWDQTEADDHQGALGRDFFSYGVRSSAYAWKVFDDIQSRVLDLYRIRHVAKSETTFWFSDANERSRELTPFTHGVEDIDPFDGFTYRLRNLWQTQRGGPGRWRSVDWLTFDMTFGFFSDVPKNRLITGGDVLQFRPENSIARNFAAPKITYRLSDTTVLAYDANYDFAHEKIDIQNLALSVERDPRLSYFLGWRQIKPTDSNLVGFGGNYKATDIHSFAIREYYDVVRNTSEEFTITYIRKLPRWYVATTFQLDNVQKDVGVSVSAWPEGLPEATIGSRKYTGIPEDIGIHP